MTVRERKLLSVIVPVFNTEERFLRKCLELFSEDMGDVELVVVDDGSDAQCRELEKTILAGIRTSAKLLVKENGGQNTARQVGLDASSGEYILFLDSDDYLDPNAFEKALTILEHDVPDVLAYNVAVVDERGCQVSEYRFFESDGFEADKSALILQSRTLFCQIVSRRLFDGYRLIEGPTVGEDVASVIPLLARASRFRLMTDELYRYVRRDSSVTHTFKPENMYDILDSFDGLLERMRQLEDSFASEVEWLAIRHIIFFGAKRVIASCGVSRAAKHRLDDYMGSRFPYWRSNPYLFSERDNQSIAFRLLINGHWKTYALMRSMKMALLGVADG